MVLEDALQLVEVELVHMGEGEQLAEVGLLAEEDVEHLAAMESLVDNPSVAGLDQDLVVMIPGMVPIRGMAVVGLWKASL